MTTNELIDEIYKVKNKVDLKMIQSALHDRWNEIEKETTINFRKGDRVCWTSTKRNMKITGTVEKVNTVSITVIETPADGVGIGLTKWTVSPSLLTKVA